ncbi:MAG: hypothetical protein Q8Q88_13840 [Phenylobacterium sp.]|uniref:hypothetical protein n=1 Tax=Phenylobacterium sp. TaxID=1871053 RepID=UPI0027341445|nr:hypothetical protein [Phenylobacterium sp.]MDP3748119.1 hypothetical protein [Phenylobacterium sp.]
MVARPTFAAAPLLALLLGLGACATPKPPVYGPIGDAEPYGYKDRSNADGGYTLLAIVPSHSSVAEASSFWDRRAQELCPAGVSKRIIFRSDRKEQLIPAGYVYGGAGISGRATRAYEVEGYLYCKVAIGR